MSSTEIEEKLPATHKEALEQGAAFYFTGKKCRRGHIAKRNIHGQCFLCRRLIAKKHYHYKQGKEIAVSETSDDIIALDRNGKPIEPLGPVRMSADGKPKGNPWEWRKKYFFSRRMANRIIKFFELRIVHIEGEKAGQAFVPERWQRRIMRRAFGWYRRSDGYRKFKTIWIEVPRKNGKSAWASGMALYVSFEDKEPGAQVVSAAAETEQAAVVFEVAKKMVERNPKLMGKIKPFKKSLVSYSTASTYKVVSAQAHTKHGKNLHGIICDEVHAQPTRDLIDVLKTSTGSRRQPMQIFLTTAGYDKNSICWEMHCYAQDLLDGVIEDDAFYPVIYAASDDDDWTKESTWFKANPNLGISKQLAYMRAECEIAQKVPAYENTFKRLELNIWTEQASRWIQMLRWNECFSAYDEKSLEGKQCIAGVDLSSSTDIAALVLLFKIRVPYKVNGKMEVKDTYKALPYFWLPGETATARAKKDRVEYLSWCQRGYINKTQGDFIDTSFIKQQIKELGERFYITEIAYDRWNAASLMTDLSGEGFEVVPMNQGYQLSSACEELTKLILAKDFQHNGNPVLTWMAKNVTVRQNGEGKIFPSKKMSRERIDGMAALIFALDRHTRDTDSVSVYEERGLITV